MNPFHYFLFHVDLSLLSRIPGQPYKESAEIKVEREDSQDRENNKEIKQSKSKRKHKVGCFFSSFSLVVSWDFFFYYYKVF